MESIVKKSLSSLLIIMMLFTIAMPAIVNAAEAKYSMKDMKLNTIIYFEGQTYSPIHYACNNEKFEKEAYPADTAGIVWKLNRRYDSLVIQLSNTRFRTIKIDQVTGIRDEKFVNIELPTLEEVKNGEMKLNIKILGEENQVEFSNGAVARLDADGALVLGFENGFSKLTINRKDGNPIELFIIKDASGNVTLDIDQRFISAEVEALLLEKIRAGADVSLQVVDGVIEIAGGAEATNPEGDFTYAGVDGKVSYDTKDPDADVMADVKIDVLDTTVIEKENVDTRIKKTIKSLISKLRAR